MKLKRTETLPLIAEVFLGFETTEFLQFLCDHMKTPPI